MTDTFRDDDPEDGWDDGDPVKDQLFILELVVETLRNTRDDPRHDRRRDDALRLLGKLAGKADDPQRIASLRAALEAS